MSAEATYLIHVVPGQDPQLFGPFFCHLDSGSYMPQVCGLGEGWVNNFDPHSVRPLVGNDSEHPNWVRDAEKLYRVTLQGVINLIDSRSHVCLPDPYNTRNPR